MANEPVNVPDLMARITGIRAHIATLRMRLGKVADFGPKYARGAQARTQAMGMLGDNINRLTGEAEALEAELEENIEIQTINNIVNGVEEVGDTPAN